MANPQDLQVKLTVDASGVTAGVDKAQDKLKQFGQAASAQSEHTNKLKESVKELGKSFMELFAAAEVIKFLAESAKVAIENQQSYALMEQQLHNTVGATKEQTAAVDENLKKLGEQAGVLQTQLRPAYDALVRATGNTTEAMKLQKVALDLSAGAHIPLETAAKALGKAYDGNTTALARLVPAVKGTKDPIDAVAKSMKGMAETAANTDPMARMKVMLEEIQVTLGKALLPVFGAFTTILKAVMPLVDLLANLIGVLVKALMPLISHLMTALMPAFQAVVKIITALAGAVLPPLIKLLDKVLVPVIMWIANFMLKYMVPAFEAYYKLLGNLVGMIVDNVIKAFQWLVKVLGPIYDTIIKPIIEGLMALLGIKPVTVKVSTDTTDFKMPDLTGTGGPVGGGSSGAGAGGSSASSTAANKADTALVTYIKNTQKLILDARKTYDDSVKAANDKYGALIQKYSDEMQSIIQASMDRLRSAFASATATDAGKMFADLNKDGTASADQLLDSLKTRLTSIKTLATNAATLAGLGFSQTFIEQVVAQGPDAGNAMADALKNATPETQKQLQDVFRQTEVTSNTGMDALAQQMYEKTGLATDAMKAQYDKASANMKQAQDDLATALSTAADTLNNSLMKISDDFTAYLLKTKADLTKHAADIAAIRNSIGGGYAPTYDATTGLTTSGNASAPGSFMNTVGYNSGQGTVVNVTAQTNATPQTIGDAVAFAIRNGSPYTYNQIMAELHG